MSLAAALAALITVGGVTATLAGDVQAAGAVRSPITDDQIAEAGLGVMAFNLRNMGAPDGSVGAVTVGVRANDAVNDDIDSSGWLVAG